MPWGELTSALPSTSWGVGDESLDGIRHTMTKLFITTLSFFTAIDKTRIGLDWIGLDWIGSDQIGLTNPDQQCTMKFPPKIVMWGEK